MDKPIKVILAILLLVCLADMPYGYYQFVRFAGFMGFGLLAFGASQERQDGWMFYYGALAILYQPFIKISLGRELWNVVDVIVALQMFLDLNKSKANDRSI